MGIGPQLPPGFAQPSNTSDNEEEEEDFSVDVGPALPPGFIKKPVSTVAGPSVMDNNNNNATEQAQQEQNPKKRRVMGPSAPPPSGLPVSSQLDEDDDDDFGPQPIPQEYSEYLNELDAERKRLEIEERVNGGKKQQQDDEGQNGPPARGAWMLVPPEVKKLNAVLGTELKGRQFSRTAKEERIDQSAWTRLPGERVEESLPKRKHVELETPQLSQHELESQKAVEEYNKVNRPKSLMEMHTKEYASSSTFAENNAAKRKFDRDRDLTSRRTDGKARQNLIDGAAKLDTRFSRGTK
ncbi:hypothetical protein BDR26DRAFT_1007914 [Obelidium mucronatum]|nr:hypothetical protein BDR26DRAFT_1007914 [Obelidium mucronatum]